MSFQHNFPFDPSYGYTLETLLQIKAPEGPPDFATFWKERYERILKHLLHPQKQPSPLSHPQFEIFDVQYLSSEDFPIYAWLVTPRNTEIKRGIIVGHGYGGREGPDFNFPWPQTAWLFPCFRGLSRSRRPPISDHPSYHVLHHIDNPHRYILGGCVEDLWLAVSTFLIFFPQLIGHIGYMGTSFGGGIGTLALAWERRIQRAYFNVPTFGHHPLRLTFPTQGSGEAVRSYHRHHGHTLETLQYYDAATAARYIQIPIYFVAALFDPFVAPPGQFAIYNALNNSSRQLFVLPAGHFDYPGKGEQETKLIGQVEQFFSPL